MAQPPKLEMGQLIALRKGHPCGANRWEVVRLGADIGLRCTGCGHKIMLSRTDLERRYAQTLS